MESVTGPILSLEEFDQLYERVWKAYATPTTPQAQIQAAMPISSAASALAEVRAASASPTPAARIIESARQRTPSVRGGRMRPLPRTPGGSSAASSPSISVSSSSVHRASSASGNTYFPYNGDTPSISDAGGRRRLPSTPGSVNESLKPYGHIAAAGGSIAEDSDDGWTSTDGRGTVSRNGSFTSRNLPTPGTPPGYEPPARMGGKGDDVYSAGVSRAAEDDVPGYGGPSNGNGNSYRGQNSDYDIVLSSNPPNDGPPPARGDTMLSVGTDQYFSFGASSANLPTADLSRRPSDILNAVSNYNAYASPPNDTFEDYNEYPTTGARGPLELHQEDWDEWGPADPEELDENRFVNFSLLSHISVQLRDKVPRGTHVKGSIPYPRAFTGRDIVSTIQALIQRELAINHGISTTDRRQALLVARSLQSQLFFYEAEWGGRVLQDGVEDVYMFLDDQEGPSENMGVMREELPTGVVTAMTQCYAPGCGEEGTVCYSPRCPRRGQAALLDTASIVEQTPRIHTSTWTETVPREVLVSLPDTEIRRQTIIHKLISKEEQYIQDIDMIDAVFIRPLRQANPPIISPEQELDNFIEDVFGNLLELRKCNSRLLEVLYVRQREQSPVIQRIGDVFLDAATEFRLAYPIYIGHHPVAEKRMKDEVEQNPDFRIFLEHCSRQTARAGETMRYDLKHFLNRPSEHLQKYPVLLKAIFRETMEGNPDADFLLTAIEAINNLQNVAQLRTFQSAMGRGVPGKWEWHDMVSDEFRGTLSKNESKRQSIIFELIKGEMIYVKDLENIEIMYIRPLRAADPPIISEARLEQFIADVFHNFHELYSHHRRLVDKLHEIQSEEHPVIRSVTAAVFDAALNFRDAYMEYIPNYPIAEYRITDEMATNPRFKAFVEQCVRHPDAHRLDMKNFINRPIPRLLRYELLLKGVMEETPPNHEDRLEIPQVLEVIKALGKDTEPGVTSAKQKVELWKYNSNLVFKPGEYTDMDLLDENRSLIYSGKLLRQPEGGLEWNGWSDLFVLLFDNYLVMTKPREKDGVTKYHVSRRPIPLDLLTMVNFTDLPTQRGAGLLRNLRGGDRHTDPSSTTSPDSSDSRSVFPFTIHYNGRMGGAYIMYSDTQQVRSEWKQKLDEALGLRRVVQDANKVFEIETLSMDTFIVPSIVGTTVSPNWSQDTAFTGKVTCSVPFNTADGRGLVAVGCSEGVWIGFRHDSRSLRRVLHLKMVTQCSMLEDFGIFLVLADKSLFAYHLEALVPSSPASVHASVTPQKLNGNKDVQFFSVGTLHGRTLVIYMKKKGLDSVFHVVEPVVDKINERTKPAAGLGSRLGFRSAKSEWFRVYREFFLPSESFDLVFLKTKIAILCGKGFEIMDLMDLQSQTIPHRDDPRYAALAKRCEQCRPLAMFKPNEDEFLLCYDEFGLYVDRHGDPSRAASTVEWEGTALRAAIHRPYVLLFDSRFIEVRHLETGRLAQIIAGNGVGCIWDGRGSSLLPPDTPNGEINEMERVVQEARVHGVMNATEPTSRLSRAVGQHVFELIPTIPLYLPGSLASPSSPTYFPQSFSPPHSPTLRPTMYR